MASSIPYGANDASTVAEFDHDKVIQNLDPTSAAFGQVDYLHYHGSDLTASYDTTQVNSNFAVFQPIVADYDSFGNGAGNTNIYSGQTQTGGPITVSTGNGGTASTDLVLMTQAEGGGPVDFVYVNDPGVTSTTTAGTAPGINPHAPDPGGAGQTILASWQNSVSVPEVHGESYFLQLIPGVSAGGTSDSFTATPGGGPAPAGSTGSETFTSTDVSNNGVLLVSQDPTNNAADLLQYVIQHQGATAGSSGGGVATLVASDEVGSASNHNLPFSFNGEIVGVADTLGNDGTYIVAQDDAGHLQFAHLALEANTGNGAAGSGASHYYVDSSVITTGTFAPVNDVNPDGIVGSGALPTVTSGGTTYAPTSELDLVANSSTNQTVEMYFGLQYGGTAAAPVPGSLTVVPGENVNDPTWGTTVESNVLPAGWTQVDGGIVAAQHFGDTFTV